MDRALVIAAQAGSAVAFEALHALYARRIYRVTLSITKNPSDAEDAVQESFLKAYRGVKYFRKEAQFSSWLTRIAINSSLMFLRRRRNKRELPMEGYSYLEDKVISLDFVDGHLSPESLFHLKQTSAGIDKFVEGLPTHLRMVAELRFLHEQSIQEISTALGISIAAAKSRLYRARKLMASRGLMSRLRQ